MSSQDHAIQSLKNNRKLLRYKGGYFKTLKAHNDGRPKRIIPFFKKPVENERKFKIIRLKKIASQLAISFTICTISLQCIFGFLMQTIERSNYNKAQARKEFKFKDNLANQLTTYNYHVKSGNYYYKEKMYNKAQSEFILAITLNPNLKDANLGLTKTLLQKCLHEHVLCNEAFDYYDQIKNSPYLSEVEKIELEGIII